MILLYTLKAMCRDSLLHSYALSHYLPCYTPDTQVNHDRNKSKMGEGAGSVTHCFMQMSPLSLFLEPIHSKFHSKMP